MAGDNLEDFFEGDDDNVQLDSQTILRLPDDLADKLCMEFQSAKTLASQQLPVEVIPLADWGWRKFIVKVYDIELTGVLVELPCYTETYKTIDDHRLFKSADVSQMIYCFYGTNYPRQFLDYKSIQCMETGEPTNAPFLWNSGLTPPTQKITKRKYKFPNWDASLVSDAEDAILRVIDEGQRDRFEIDYVTHEELVKLAETDSNRILTNLEDMASEDDEASNKMFFGGEADFNEEEDTHQPEDDEDPPRQTGDDMDGRPASSVGPSSAVTPANPADREGLKKKREELKQHKENKARVQKLQADLYRTFEETSGAPGATQKVPPKQAGPRAPSSLVNGPSSTVGRGQSKHDGRATSTVSMGTGVSLGWDGMVVGGEQSGLEHDVAGSQQNLAPDQGVSNAANPSFGQQQQNNEVQEEVEVEFDDAAAELDAMFDDL